PGLDGLPQNRKHQYYVAAVDGSRVKAVKDLKSGEEPEFAAAVGRDALARAKALGTPLATTLQQAEQATKVPARALAIHYTESALKKQRCDEKCLDAPGLDPEVNHYLKGLQKPGHP